MRGQGPRFVICKICSRRLQPAAANALTKGRRLKPAATESCGESRATGEQLSVLLGSLLLFGIRRQGMGSGPARPGGAKALSRTPPCQHRSEIQKRGLSPDRTRRNAGVGQDRRTRPNHPHVVHDRCKIGKSSSGAGASHLLGRRKAGDRVPARRFLWARLRKIRGVSRAPQSLSAGSKHSIVIGRCPSPRERG